MRQSLALFVLLFCTANVFGQDNPPSYYAFAGAGAATSTFGRSTALFHVGGGTEIAVKNGLGFGAEFGYLGPWSNGSNGVGVLSLDGLYRFSRANDTQPFLNGGYSLGFRSSAAHFANIGGGITRWLRSGTGLRIEFRDNIRDPSTHWLIFRVGVAFR
jgi:hypothetical protein